MPFVNVTEMESRKLFVEKSREKAVDFKLLCSQFHISRKTGYKWIKRYESDGLSGLESKSKRPHHSPMQIDKEIEALVLSKRDEFGYGSKKIRAMLLTDKEKGIYLFACVPSANTIQNILQRNGRISLEASQKAQHYQSFCKEKPNELWQMDFKGYFKMSNSEYCHPFTMMDDHSRFNLALIACANQQHITVKEILTSVFREVGLPDRILADNGNPWGTTGSKREDGSKSFTRLEKWLMELGISVTHGRPYHPQTQGKEERFHRSFKEELLIKEQFLNLPDAQLKFDKWQQIYNYQRPHHALDLQVPAKLYLPSNKSFVEIIYPYDYSHYQISRKVTAEGIIQLENQKYHIGKAFGGERIGINPSEKDGIFQVFFRSYQIATIDLTINK